MQLFGMSTSTWSWVVSIFAIGGIVGGLLGGPLVNYLGPKWCQLGNNLVWFAGGLCLALSPENSSGVIVLLVGRFICGIATGISCSAVPMYVNDVSPTHVRGAFGVFHQLFITIGILVSSVLSMDTLLGTTSLWRILYGFFLVPAALNCGMLTHLNVRL